MPDDVYAPAPGDLTVGTYDNVVVDIDGPVATITLNRPEKLNALSQGLLADLQQALRDLNPGDDVRVIRVRGAGRAFCAGYDLTPRPRSTSATPRQRGNQAWDLPESRIAADREGLRQSVDRWLWMWSYRKPIVAQVHGYALAGGGELIGACDIVFAAEDAQLGHPPGRAMGIPPTLGMWPFKIGMLKSKELLMTGDMISGTEAERIGMVNRAIPPDRLDAETMAFCQRIAMVPLEGLTAHKHVVNRWFEIAGIRTAAAEGVEFDAIWHEAKAFAEFGRISQERGLKAALSWRDDPWRQEPGGGT